MKRLPARWFEVSSLREIGIVVAFIIIVAILMVLSPTAFAKPANLLNILKQASINGILATGMMFVIISGGIDLSVGSLIALVSVIAALVLRGLASEDASAGSGYGDAAIAAAIGIGVAGLCGLLLSLKPDMTAEDVRAALIASAKKIGPGNAYKASGHSNKFGYGRIDAAKAVALVKASKAKAKKAKPDR